MCLFGPASRPFEVPEGGVMTRDPSIGAGSRSGRRTWLLRGQGSAPGSPRSFLRVWLDRRSGPEVGTQPNSRNLSLAIAAMRSGVNR